MLQKKFVESCAADETVARFETAMRCRSYAVISRASQLVVRGWQRKYQIVVKHGAGRKIQPRSPLPREEMRGDHVGP